jgi:hypothetical protein
MTDRELLEVAFKHLSVYYDKHMPIIKQLRTQLDQPVCTPRDFKYSTIEEAMEPMPPAPGLPQPSKDELEFANAMTTLLKAGFGKEAMVLVRTGHKSPGSL